MSWSRAMPKKSMIMISATGSRPSIAAPTAAPRMAASEIGVSRTRWCPYFVDSPAVRQDPPGSAMSSPSRTTLSLRPSPGPARDSSPHPSTSLFRPWPSSYGVADRGCPTRLVEFVRRWRVGGEGPSSGFLHAVNAPRRCRSPLLRWRGRTRRANDGSGHRIGGHLRFQFFLGDIGHPVAEVVAEEAKRHASMKVGPRRPGPCVATASDPRPQGGRSRRPGHRAFRSRPLGRDISIFMCRRSADLGVPVVLADEDHRKSHTRPCSPLRGTTRCSSRRRRS